MLCCCYIQVKPTNTHSPLTDLAYTPVASDSPTTGGPRRSAGALWGNSWGSCQLDNKLLREAAPSVGRRGGWRGGQPCVGACIRPSEPASKKSCNIPSENRRPLASPIVWKVYISTLQKHRGLRQLIPARLTRA